MAYASLYRKYRPKGFDEVIGQDAVVRTLRNMVKNDNIAHAYLFTGTRGTGKTSVARIFAKAVNCKDNRNGSPCGMCSACRAFDSAGNVDFIELDAASNNSIDDVRALRESVKYPPADSELRYKVFIIDEAHQLSTQAFNAFLKTLEEPPAYCIYILATTEVQKLPQTILSRCLRFDFALVGQEELADHVAHIYDLEGAKYSRDAVLAIARAGQGSVRDTLSVADTCLTATNGDVTYESVLEVLGANDPTLVADMAEDILLGRLDRALRMVAQTAAKGKSIVMLARDLTQYLRDLLIVKADTAANEYLRLPDQALAVAQAIAAKVERADIVRVLNIFIGLDTSMRYTSNPRTILESAIAKATSVSGNEVLDMAAKLAALERKVAQCAEDIAHGVVPAVATDAQGNDVAPAIDHQRADSAPDVTQDSAAESGAEVDADTVQDDLFDTEAPLATMPTDEMNVRAVAVHFRTELTQALATNKYLMLSTIVSMCFVTIKGNAVSMAFNSENDKTYCERNREVIERFARPLLPFEATFAYEYNPRKQNADDDVTNLINMVGANKVTKK